MGGLHRSPLPSSLPICVVLASSLFISGCSANLAGLPTPTWPPPTFTEAPRSTPSLAETATSTQTPTPPKIEASNTHNLRVFATLDTAPIEALAWSPDTANFAVADSFFDAGSNATAHSLRLIHFASLEQVWSSEQHASDLIFDMQGRLIAGSSLDSGPTIIDPATGDIMGQLGDNKDHLCGRPFILSQPASGDPLFAASLAPTLGNDLAWVCTWDLAGDHKPTNIQYQDGELDSFSVSADGTLYSLGIVNAMGYPFLTTQVRLLSSNVLRCALPGSLAQLSPSGSTLAVYDAETLTITTYDSTNCQPIAVSSDALPDLINGPSSLVFSDTGELLALAGPSIVLLDAASLLKLGELSVCDSPEEDCNVTDLAFSPDGHYLLAGLEFGWTDQGRILLWSTSD